jgi:hypothetical protein
MARYWWQCTSCGDRPAWLTVCQSRSIAAFIWDELAPSGWDQRLLRRRCRCKRTSLRITYRFRRGDPDRVSIKHIVGLAPDGDYLPMLWETFRHSSPRTNWIDFKYQRGRSPWGLTKRLVLEKHGLARLLRKYEQATGTVIVPLPKSRSSGGGTGAKMR